MFYFIRVALVLASLHKNRAVTNTMTKSNLGRRWFILPYITYRSQGKNLKAGTRAKAMQKCSLLTCHGLLSLLSYSAQDHYLHQS